ncbi:MAG: RidA family protein [Gammaproteobacteria bacterium]|nr:RidA family protein [Gammaproteobacteria bacterium]
MTDKHVRIASGAPWESQAGYCRAVKAGNIIAVSGSASIGSDGKLVGEGDMYQQTQRCIQVITEALEKAGASLSDVVRTRTFVTDIEQWKEVARAHRDAFGAAPPATSMVEVSRLIDPRMLVEIEADAILSTD